MQTTRFDDKQHELVHRALDGAREEAKGLSQAIQVAFNNSFRREASKARTASTIKLGAESSKVFLRHLCRVFASDDTKELYKLGDDEPMVCIWEAGNNPTNGMVIEPVALPEDAPMGFVQQYSKEVVEAKMLEQLEEHKLRCGGAEVTLYWDCRVEVSVSDPNDSDAKFLPFIQRESLIEIAESLMRFDVRGREASKFRERELHSTNGLMDVGAHGGLLQLERADRHVVWRWQEGVEWQGAMKTKVNFYSSIMQTIKERAREMPGSAALFAIANGSMAWHTYIELEQEIRDSLKNGVEGPIDDMLEPAASRSMVLEVRHVHSSNWTECMTTDTNKSMVSRWYEKLPEGVFVHDLRGIVAANRVLIKHAKEWQIRVARQVAKGPIRHVHIGVALRYLGLDLTLRALHDDSTITGRDAPSTMKSGWRGYAVKLLRVPVEPIPDYGIEAGVGLVVLGDLPQVAASLFGSVAGRKYTSEKVLTVKVDKKLRHDVWLNGIAPLCTTTGFNELRARVVEDRDVTGAVTSSIDAIVAWRDGRHQSIWDEHLGHSAQQALTKRLSQTLLLQMQEASVAAFNNRACVYNALEAREVEMPTLDRKVSTRLLDVWAVCVCV